MMVEMKKKKLEMVITIAFVMDIIIVYYYHC